ncbi:MAG: O-antigen ligase family protein [Bacteroidaceae bacterium]|nr:O-antigen ligase family protein [Bacteroidaceae bacterium]
MDLILFLIAVILIIKQSKFEWVLVIIMALSTNIFSTASYYTGIFLFPNISDGALVLIIVLYLYNYKIKEIYSEEYQSFKQIIKLFLIYIGLITIIDLFINGTSIISILKTSRHWIALIFAFTITKLPINSIKKAIDIVFKITLILSTIIVVEHFTNIHYFTPESKEHMGIIRGILPSYYAFFYVILLYSNYYNNSKRKNILYFTILCTSLLISSTRSIALGLIVAVIICTWFISKNRVKSILKVIGVISIMYLSSFFLTTLNQRFNEMFEELSTTKDSSSQVEGNATFRLYMLKERYDYLKTDAQYYLFGIGNIIEEDFPQIFHIGLGDSKTGRITQLDTGDITWPLIILRLGIIGLIIFLIIHYKIAYIAIKAKYTPLSLALFTYIFVCILINSFAGSRYATSYFLILPILCTTLICYNKK